MKMTGKHFKSLVAVPLLTALLAACNSHNYASIKQQDQVHRGSVQMVRLPHVIVAEPDGTSTPSHVTYAALDQFLSGADAGYGDRVLLDTSRDVSADRIEGLSAFIKMRGLEYGGTAVLGEKPEDGAVILYLERHIYTPPTCGNWAAEKSDDDMNNRSSFHGCSTQRVLGQMVADPRDLVSGQTNSTDQRKAVSEVKKHETRN